MSLRLDSTPSWTSILACHGFFIHGGKFGRTGAGVFHLSIFFSGTFNNIYKQRVTVQVFLKLCEIGFEKLLDTSNIIRKIPPGISQNTVK